MYEELKQEIQNRPAETINAGEKTTTGRLAAKKQRG